MQNILIRFIISLSNEIKIVVFPMETLRKLPNPGNLRSEIRLFKIGTRGKLPPILPFPHAGGKEM